MADVTIIGGGLAGCEAARVLAQAGFASTLFEMRPARPTPAHQSDRLAELVCSNSFGSVLPHTSKGVLLEELRRLGSIVVRAATRHAVPAGASLAVDREGFAGDVTGAIGAFDSIEVRREEVTAVPATGPVLVATGPLTSDALAASLATHTGDASLYFYDAIAPIVSAESIDRSVVYAKSRYDKGEPDFLNCPLDEEQYHAFVDALLAAESVAPKDFETACYFEGCMPIEAMAERGRESLAFGPLRPVGLNDPKTGRRPYAVVQLRREDRDGQLYNLVGCQTKMRYGEQPRVFGMIPGLQSADFVRLGAVHRNTFLNAPRLLADDLSLKTRRDLFFGGLVAGTEGYAESSALGVMAALAVRAKLRGETFVPPPRTTMIGGLMAYLREADAEHFQPMNVNFGLLPPFEEKIKGKRARRLAAARRALTDFDAWIAEQDLGWLEGVPTEDLFEGVDETVPRAGRRARRRDAAKEAGD